MFYIFKVYTYLACRVNFVVDTIQHDRFTYERRIAKRFGDSETCPIQCQRQGHQIKRGLWLGLVDDLVWMLEYNQLKLFHLLLYLANLSFLLIYSIVSLCYIVKSSDRDPKTGQYNDPVMRFIDSLYLFEIWRKSEDVSAIHKSSLIICFPIALRRIESLIFKLRNSKINRYQYVKLNAIQINVAQTDYFAVPNWRSFWNFLRALREHKCRQKYTLRGPKSQRYKQMASRMLGLHKIDRLYYYNPLDFDDCFRDASRYLIEYGRRQVSGYSREHHQLTAYDGRKSLSERLAALLTRSQSSLRLFSARPIHRVRPHASHVIIVLYLLALLVYIMVIPFSILVFYYPFTFDYGLERDNILITFPVAFIGSLEDPKNLAAFIELTLYMTFAAINLCDTACLVHNAVVELSRATAVIDMLDVEVDFHRNHLRAFSKYLLKNNLTIFGLTEFNGRDDDDDDDEDDNDFGDDFDVGAEMENSDFDPEVGPKPTIGDYCGEVFGDTQYVANAADLLMRNHLRGREVEQLIRDFKISTVHQGQLLDFNENIRYLLNLIKTLQEEYADLTVYFTLSLNLGVLTGTVGLSVVSSMYYNCKTFHHAVSITLGTYVIVVPLIVSLFMGATSEISFRKITKKIQPLMLNELKLIDLETIKDLQNVYSHLSSIKNRSFMVLGNLPLTFGSLPSVSILVKIKYANIIYSVCDSNKLT